MASATSNTIRAGQAAPDEAFYAQTFKKSQLNRMEQIRGLNITNATARHIDIKIDTLLREDSPHTVRAGSRAKKYWELAGGKDSDWLFEHIYITLLKEFEAFGSE